MAKTSVVYARVDADIKKGAEEILAQLGISPSTAISMYYGQIIIKRGIPFEIRLPDSYTVGIDSVTNEDVEEEPLKED